MGADKSLYQVFKVSQSTVRQMSEVECAWLAVAIDGEGSIGIYNYGREGRRIQISLANTNEAFVKYTKDIVGNIGSSVNRYTYGGNTRIPRNKPIYQWTLKGSNRCYAVLKQIVDYLIIKRDLASEMILEMELYPFGRWNNVTDEGRKKQSEITKRTWADPVIRQNRIMGMRKGRLGKGGDVNCD